MTDTVWTEVIAASGKTKLTLPEDSTVVITKIMPAEFQEKKGPFTVEIETTDADEKNPERTKIAELSGDETKPIKLNIIAISDIPPTIINNSPFSIKLTGKLFGEGLDEEEEEPGQPEIPPADVIQARFKKIGDEQESFNSEATSNTE